MSGLLTLLVLDLSANDQTRRSWTWVESVCEQPRENLRAELMAIAGQADALNQRFVQPARPPTGRICWTSRVW